MNDVVDRLAALRSTATVLDSELLVADDLGRAHRALTIRRSRRAVGGFFIAAAVTVSSAYGLASHDGRHSPAAIHQPGTVASVTASPGASASAGADKIHLVAYVGAQPAGFHITDIPAGFGLRLQGSNTELLVLARTGDTTSVDDFAGKVVVSLQSADAAPGGSGHPVQVKGQPGTLDTQQGTKILVFKTGSHNVNVQAWADLGFTDQQLIQFAAGITVIGNPATPRG